jgi:chromosomal replication initiation ATPase DnaA
MVEVPIIELGSAAEVRANNRMHLERRREITNEIALRAAQSELIQLRWEAKQKDYENYVLVTRLSELQKEFDVMRAAQLAPTPQLLMGDILVEVSKHFDISINDILSARRNKDVVHARQISMWMIEAITKKSLADIGRKMHFHHTSVMSNVKRIEERCQRDESFRIEVMQLKAKIVRDLEACLLKEAAVPKTREIGGNA